MDLVLLFNYPCNNAATFQMMLDTTISPLFEAIIMGIACSTAVSLCKGYDEKTNADKKSKPDNLPNTDGENKNTDDIERIKKI